MYYNCYSYNTVLEVTPETKRAFYHLEPEDES